jgi:hypothetical protein
VRRLAIVAAIALSIGADAFLESGDWMRMAGLSIDARPGAAHGPSAPRSIALELPTPIALGGGR